MSDFTVHRLLSTPLIEVRDVLCAGRCRHKGAIERAGRSQLVFPYRGSYVRHVGDARGQLGGVFECQRLDLRAGAATVVPQAQQLFDPTHRKPEQARTLDETQALQVGVVVQAIAGKGALRRRDHPGGFVAADHLGADAGRGRGFADVVEALLSRLGEFGTDCVPGHGKPASVGVPVASVHPDRWARSSWNPLRKALLTLPLGQAPTFALRQSAASNGASP
jgi:hypothetical protein